MNQIPQHTLTDEQLMREYDRTQAQAFLGKSAAFFGSLLCSLKFSWQRENCDTAQTDSTELQFNPDFFVWLKPETRKTVLMHELWHVGYLHGVRQGSRDPEFWNYACDIYINNQLEDDGYSFEGVENCWKDPKYKGWVEEDIYDDLMKNPHKKPKALGAFGTGSGGDMVSPTSGSSPATIVNNVVRALQQQKLAGGTLAGTGAGRMQEVITQFLKPVVPWQQVLFDFFTDIDDTKYTWARPNRRYPDMYLPSLEDDEGRLRHLAYFEDVSGSISNADSLRFNSEVAYVKSQFNPKRMTLLTFDTVIQDEIDITEEDTFEEIKITGRGGTCLRPVREWIIKNKPTAAIIFSDMHVAPMEELPFDIPIIWVCLGNRSATVPFGEILHIDPGMK